ncbi:MAG: threonine/serine exporter family protein [Clostridiales bacterium]|jgi:uncharacterized membrane protein YjjB (DUF3815 family)|nr:threonine/serine exporter family protein [Clostridiales bacterium]
MTQQFIFAFIGTLSFCVLFKAPKGEIIFCGLTGALAWLLYCVLINKFSAFVSVFISVVSVGVLSKILSVRRKMPLTVFIIAGIMPFAPGGVIYNSIYMLIMGDTAASLAKAIETIKTACTISIALVVVLAIPNNIFKPFKT